jgi:hypothetical protein
MASLKCLRTEARGRFGTHRRRWRWLGRAPPVRTRCGKTTPLFLQRKYYPITIPAASHLATYSAFASSYQR